MYLVILGRYLGENSINSQFLKSWVIFFVTVSSKVHDTIFIAHSIFYKIYLYGLKGGYDALNFLDILIPNIKIGGKILKINHFNRIL